MSSQSSIKDLSYYSVLSINSAATTAQIEVAYKALVEERRLSKSEAKDMPEVLTLERLNQAHQVLKNPVSRKAYDILIHSQSLETAAVSVPAADIKKSSALPSVSEANQDLSKLFDLAKSAGLGPDACIDYFKNHVRPAIRLLDLQISKTFPEGFSYDSWLDIAKSNLSNKVSEYSILLAKNVLQQMVDHNSVFWLDASQKIDKDFLMDLFNKNRRTLNFLCNKHATIFESILDAPDILEAFDWAGQDISRYIDKYPTLEGKILKNDQLKLRSRSFEIFISMPSSDIAVIVRHFKQKSFSLDDFQRICFRNESVACEVYKNQKLRVMFSEEMWGCIACYKPSLDALISEMGKNPITRLTIHDLFFRNRRSVNNLTAALKNIPADLVPMNQVFNYVDRWAYRRESEGESCFERYRHYCILRDKVFLSIQDNSRIDKKFTAFLLLKDFQNKNGFLEIHKKALDLLSPRALASVLGSNLDLCNVVWNSASLREKLDNKDWVLIAQRRGCYSDFFKDVIRNIDKISATDSLAEEINDLLLSFENTNSIIYLLEYSDSMLKIITGKTIETLIRDHSANCQKLLRYILSRKELLDKASAYFLLIWATECSSRNSLYVSIKDFDGILSLFNRMLNLYVGVRQIQFSAADMVLLRSLVEGYSGAFVLYKKSILGSEVDDAEYVRRQLLAGYSYLKSMPMKQDAFFLLFLFDIMRKFPDNPSVNFFYLYYLKNTRIAKVSDHKIKDKEKCLEVLINMGHAPLWEIVSNQFESTRYFDRLDGWMLYSHRSSRSRCLDSLIKKNSKEFIKKNPVFQYLKTQISIRRYMKLYISLLSHVFFSKVSPLSVMLHKVLNHSEAKKHVPKGVLATFQHREEKNCLASVMNDIEFRKAILTLSNKEEEGSLIVSCLNNLLGSDLKKHMGADGVGKIKARDPLQDVIAIIDIHEYIGEKTGERDCFLSFLRWAKGLSGKNNEASKAACDAYLSRCFSPGTFSYSSIFFKASDEYCSKLIEIVGFLKLNKDFLILVLNCLEPLFKVIENNETHSMSMQ